MTTIGQNYRGCVTLVTHLLWVFLRAPSLKYGRRQRNKKGTLNHQWTYKSKKTHNVLYESKETNFSNLPRGGCCPGRMEGPEVKACEVINTHMIYEPCFGQLTREAHTWSQLSSGDASSSPQSLRAESSSPHWSPAIISALIIAGSAWTLWTWNEDQHGREVSNATLTTSLTELSFVTHLSYHRSLDL